MKSIAKNMSRFIKDGRKMKEQKSMLMTFGLVKKFPMVLEAWKPKNVIIKAGTGEIGIHF